MDDPLETVGLGDILPYHLKDDYGYSGGSYMAGDLVLTATTTSVNDALTQSGVSDELSLVYTFTRGPNKIFLLFYLPTIVFMAISWFSLLLGPMAITRSVMNMLSLVLLFLNFIANMADLPRTNGITSIDLWKIFSILFVLIIILELVVVSLMASVGRSRRCCRSRNSHRKGKYEIEPLYEELNDLRQRKTRRTCGCCRISAMVLDGVTFFVTAAIFASFVLVYHFERDVVINFLNNFDIKSLKFF